MRTKSHEILTLVLIAPLQLDDYWVADEAFQKRLRIHNLSLALNVGRMYQGRLGRRPDVSTEEDTPWFRRWNAKASFWHKTRGSTRVNQTGSLNNARMCHSATLSCDIYLPSRYLRCWELKRTLILRSADPCSYLRNRRESTYATSQGGVALAYHAFW